MSAEPLNFHFSSAPDYFLSGAKHPINGTNYFMNETEHPIKETNHFMNDAKHPIKETNYFMNGAIHSIKGTNTNSFGEHKISKYLKFNHLNTNILKTT